MKGHPNPTFDYQVVDGGQVLWPLVDVCADYSDARNQARDCANARGRFVWLRRRKTQPNIVPSLKPSITFEDTKILPTSIVSPDGKRIQAIMKGRAK
jgi:hypothetical protein